MPRSLDVNPQGDVGLQIQDALLQFMTASKTKKFSKKYFSKEEDDFIVQAVGDNKYPKWNEIAAQLPGRTGRQVRERFAHYLSSSISREDWTQQEDDKLKELHDIYGSDWATIAAHLPGRTNTGVKNRYNVHVSPKYRPIPKPSIPKIVKIIVPQPSAQKSANLDFPSYLHETKTETLDLPDYPPVEDDPYPEDLFGLGSCEPAFDDTFGETFFF